MINKRFAVQFGIILVALIILISIGVNSVSAKDPKVFKQLYPIFIAINVVGLLIVSTITLFDLFQVFRVYRLTGTRFLMRLLRSIVLLIILPITLLYLFSLTALHSSVNSLFNFQVEKIVGDAIFLSDKMRDVFYADAIEKTDQLFADISKFNTNENFANILDKVRSRYNAYEVAIFTQNNFAAYFSSEALNKINPLSLGDKVLAQIKQGNYYINIENYDAKAYIRVVKPFYQSPLRVLDNFVLQVIYPVSNELQLLGDRIEWAQKNYQQQVYLRGPLQSVFLFNLFLVLLLGLLFSIWVTVRVARRMSKPVFELAKATNRVSMGDYQTPIKLTNYDEFGQLAHSFNYMIAQIADAQNKVISSHQSEESQRIYLDRLLAQLSTGILIFHKKNGVLIDSNRAAQILFSDQLNQLKNIILKDIINQSSGFIWPELIHKNLSQSRWETSLLTKTSQGFRHLVFRGRDLNARLDEMHHIVVFEDVTDLIHAQKQAAWVEVAKCLAHEIKNPLTPIQLAAERIRQKYAQKLEQSDVKVLNKSVNTIIEQVQSMKSMVQEFSEYARNAAVKFEYLDLNQLIQDVLFLYQGTDQHIVDDLVDDLPMVYISPKHIRGLCINLLKNAIEATKKESQIVISTKIEHNHHDKYVVLCIEDDGIGIPDEKIDQIFEPYFTSKPKGTGLGLAIVKKVVEEHGALIMVQRGRTQGAAITIKFPIYEK